MVPFSCLSFVRELTALIFRLAGCHGEVPGPHQVSLGRCGGCGRRGREAGEKGVVADGVVHDAVAIEIAPAVRDARPAAEHSIKPGANRYERQHSAAIQLAQVAQKRGKRHAKRGEAGHE